MSQKFKNYREATYSYHRLGLDQMYSDPNAARKAMANAIAMVEKIRSDNPTNMLGQWFINAKSDEIISAFADKQVPPTDKMKVYNAMILLDAANKPSYDKLMPRQATRRQQTCSTMPTKWHDGRQYVRKREITSAPKPPIPPYPIASLKTPTICQQKLAAILIYCRAAWLVLPY
jgi:hypothetical protein